MIPTVVPESPFLWWGPSGATGPRRSLSWLVERGMLSAPVAGLLAAAVARRLSLAVVAGPSGAGKTTLLTAVLAHLPADAHRIYPRGQWESFAFLNDPGVNPARDAVLVNEISPHLPGYLWGAGVGRLLDAARRGFAAYATAHASDGDGFCRMLAESAPLLPADAATAFHLVAGIDTSGGERRVSGIWALSPTGTDGLRAVPVCTGDAGLGEIESGLRRARRAGWGSGRDTPDVRTVAGAMRRLEIIGEDDGRGAERPGRMLARSRSTPPNGRAQLP